MGFDEDYNGISKVTAIVSSESISKEETFDIMARFLWNHKTTVPTATTSPSSSSSIYQQHGVDQNYYYHFWDDLYNIAETLADNKNASAATTYSKQQATLRGLRLSTKVLSSKHDDDDNIIDQIPNNHTAHTSDKDQRPPSLKSIPIKQEDDIDVTMETQHTQKPLTIAKKEKKEKSKEKKRKREEEK